MCAHRELFEDCALIFVGEDGELHSFKFVYASQSPHMACFSEIVRDSPDAEPADVTDIHNWQQTSGQRWARRYKIDLLKIFEDHQLPAMEEERMAVLPQLIFLSEWLVVSDAEPLPWNRFIEGLPPARKSAPPAERSAGATSPHMQADLVAQYPWLAQLAQPSTTRSAASSTQTTAAMDTSDHPTEGTEAPSQGDQSLLDEAWADLYRARQELHQDDEAEPTDFRYTMLGGGGLDYEKPRTRLRRLLGSGGYRRGSAMVPPVRDEHLQPILGDDVRGPRCHRAGARVVSPNAVLLLPPQAARWR